MKPIEIQSLSFDSSLYLWYVLPAHVMNNFFKSLLKKQGVKIAIFFIIALIAIDTIATYRYKLAMNENLDTQSRLDRISSQKATIISNLNNIDMSLRGYLLVQNEAFLGTYEKIKTQSGPTMSFLETSLPTIGIPVAALEDMNKMLDNYFKLMDNVIFMAQSGDMEGSLKIIKEDHGTAVWQTYMNLSAIVDPMVQQQKLASQDRYNRLLNWSLSFQTTLLLLGIPTLGYTAFNLARTQKKRTSLFQQLDQQNRTLIFDSNQPARIDDEDSVINDIITNLTKSANFIKGIAQGNYDVRWDGFSAAGVDRNKHNISGELLIMRDEMKKKKDEDVRQQWVSEGLNKAAEIIRDYQSNFETLCEKSLYFITKYLKAQQGGLYVLNEDNAEDPHLALVSCYAFDKKKFVTKRIDIGEGILGQIYQEGHPVYLTEVPKDYVKITSGLGESNPRCITIYPLKHNETVVALIEIASFTPYDQYALDFLANVCKSIAASLITLQSNARTKILLEQSQQQAEEMRAQEEEMRQNMEELQATQEEMQRREKDLRKAVNG
jgi:CHASE3 domain sensor protein